MRREKEWFFGSVGYCLLHQWHFGAGTLNARKCIKKKCNWCVLFQDSGYFDRFPKKRLKGMKMYRKPSKDYYEMFRELIEMRNAEPLPEEPPKVGFIEKTILKRESRQRKSGAGRRQRRTHGNGKGGASTPPSVYSVTSKLPPYSRSKSLDDKIVEFR